MRRISFMFVVLVGLSSAAIATECAAEKQFPQACVTVSQDSKPVVARRIKGGVYNNAYQQNQAGACVGLFRDSDKTFVASIEADKHGSFQFPDLPEGDYVLLVLDSGSLSAQRLQLSKDGKRKWLDLRVVPETSCGAVGLK